MKNDSNLPTLHADESRPKPRMSRQVLAPMLIVAGVIGVPLAFGLSQCSSRTTAPTTSPPTVNTETTYPNNHFLAGAGYYHAPYQRWFPLPYNSYDAARGWYRGGAWRRTPDGDPEQEKAPSQSAGVMGHPMMGPGAAMALMHGSRPTPDAVQSANAAASAQSGAVMRGGFGQSSRPGVS